MLYLLSTSNYMLIVFVFIHFFIQVFIVKADEVVITGEIDLVGAIGSSTTFLLPIENTDNVPITTRFLLLESNIESFDVSASSISTGSERLTREEVAGLVREKKIPLQKRARNKNRKNNENKKNNNNNLNNHRDIFSGYSSRRLYGDYNETLYDQAKQLPSREISVTTRSVPPQTATRLLLKLRDGSPKQKILIEELQKYRGIISSLSKMKKYSSSYYPFNIELTASNIPEIKSGDYISFLLEDTDYYNTNYISAQTFNSATDELKQILITTFGLWNIQSKIRSACGLRYLTSAKTLFLYFIDTQEISPLSLRTELLAFSSIKNNEDVDFIEPDIIVKGVQETNLSYHNNLNDPDINQQWNLGDSPGIEDTGVDYNHPDLKQNIWINEKELNGQPNVDDDGNGFVDDIYGYNFADDNGDPMDIDGHGTHCAGIIGAQSNNKIGISGTSFNSAKIMPLKFMRNSQHGFLSDALQAIDYGIANGASILNNSWGGTPVRSDSLLSIIQVATSNNVLFVAASGNSGQNNDNTPDYPSSFLNSGILSVGAIDRGGKLTSFSNYGTKTVHIAAPGDKIYSTIPNNKYEYRSGTSMATPAATGVAAALLSSYNNNNMNIIQIKEIIIQSSIKSTKLNSKINGGILNMKQAFVQAEQIANSWSWIQLPNNFSNNNILKSGEKKKFRIITTIPKSNSIFTGKLAYRLENNNGNIIKEKIIPINIKSINNNNNNNHNNNSILPKKINIFSIPGISNLPIKLINSVANNDFRDYFLQLINISGTSSKMFYTIPKIKQKTTNKDKIELLKTSDIWVGCNQSYNTQLGQGDALLQVKLTVMDKSNNRIFEQYTHTIALTCEPIHLSLKLIQTDDKNIKSHGIEIQPRTPNNNNINILKLKYSLEHLYVQNTKKNCKTFYNQSINTENNSTNIMYYYQLEYIENILTSQKTKWIELSTSSSAHKLRFTTDKPTATLPIGSLNWKYQGRNVDKLYISPHGFCSINPLNEAYPNETLQSTKGVLAPFLTKLQSLSYRRNSGVFVAKLRSLLVIQWNIMTIGSSYQKQNTFQIQIPLDKKQNINFLYKRLNAFEQDNVSIGLSYLYGNKDTTVFNQGLPKNDSAIIFSPTNSKETNGVVSNSSSYTNIQPILKWTQTNTENQIYDLNWLNGPRQHTWEKDESNSNQKCADVYLHIQVSEERGPPQATKTYQAAGVMLIYTEEQSAQNGNDTGNNTEELEQTHESLESDHDNEQTSSTPPSNEESWIHDSYRKQVDSPLSQFFRVPGHGLAGVNAEFLHNTTVRDCAQLCIKAGSGNCRSFDYDITRGQCMLSRQTRRTAQQRFVVAPTRLVDYYELRD